MFVIKCYGEGSASLFPKAMVKQFNCLGADVIIEEKYFSGAYLAGSHCCGCSC